MVHKIAEILKVNPDYLMAPAPSTSEEIMRTLLFLDENNGGKLSAQEVITEDGKKVKRNKEISYKDMFQLISPHNFCYQIVINRQHKRPQTLTTTGFAVYHFV